ncbi:MAG TPA: hypothetical protein VFW50_16595 [Streptosporangiaceae bacterium]|nr:hypothetical protein [Streptosporangiaceae bacterium]
MCDLSRAEQGSLTTLLGDLQAAPARLPATYPDIFSRARAHHEAMLAALDELTVRPAGSAPGSPSSTTPPWPDPGTLAT